MQAFVVYHCFKDVLDVCASNAGGSRDQDSVKSFQSVAAIWKT